MILLKDKVREALTPAEATLLAEALDQLAAMRLEAAARWRVTQLEHVLTGHTTEWAQLDEP